MKKRLLILTTAAMMMFATACGGSEPASTTPAADTTAAKTEAVVTTEAQTTEAVTTEAPTEAKSNIYFDGDTMKIVDGELTITDVKVMDPDSSWGEENKKIVISYSFTNTNSTGEALEPSTFWFACFQVKQEDSNAEYDLDIAMMPDDMLELSDNGNASVKVGGTLEAAIAYELKFDGKPVKIIGSQGMFGDVLGTKIVETK